MTVLSVSTEVFACYSAACRPPTSGGTGGSGGSGKFRIKWAAGPPPRFDNFKPSADEMPRAKAAEAASGRGSTTGGTGTSGTSTARSSRSTAHLRSSQRKEFESIGRITSKNVSIGRKDGRIIVKGKRLSTYKFEVGRDSVSKKYTLLVPHMTPFTNGASKSSGYKLKRFNSIKAIKSYVAAEVNAVVAEKTAA